MGLLNLKKKICEGGSCCSEGMKFIDGKCSYDSPSELVDDAIAMVKNSEIINMNASSESVDNLLDVAQPEGEKLLTEWKESQTATITAYEDEIRAGIGYYNSTDTNYILDQSEDNNLRSRYEKYIDNYIERDIAKFNTSKDILDKMIISEESNRVTFNRIQEIYNLKKRKKEEMEFKIEELKKNINTNKRKVSYEEIAIKNLFIFKYFLQFFILIIAILYIYYVSIKDYKNYMSWIIPSILIAIIFFKKKISEFLYISIEKIYYTITTSEAKNVYVNL